MAQASFNNKDKGGAHKKDRLSMVNQPTATLGQANWKAEEFDENQMFNDEANYFDITQKFNRHTIGGSKHHMQSASLLRGDAGGASGSPEQPLRMNKFQASPKMNAGISDESQGESVDERLNTHRSKPTVKKRLYNKSKLGQKTDIGQMNQEQANYLQKIQKLLQEDSGQAESKDAWETVNVQNGLSIQAQNPKPHRLTIDKKKLIAHVKLLGIVALLFFIVRNWLGFEIDYFYLGIILQIINFKKGKGIFALQNKYGLLKAKAIISGDPETIGQEILKCYQQNHQDSFDFMTVGAREITRDDAKHLLTTEETLDLPSDFISRQFLERRQMKALSYWCQDDNGFFYVLRKSLPPPGTNSKNLTNIQEAFVCVPIDNNKSEKCLVYFFSDFNYGKQGPKLIMNSYFDDQIKVMRMSILSSMIQYQKFLNEKQMREVFQITREVEQQVMPKTNFDLAAEMELNDSYKLNRVNSISSNQGGDHQNEYRGNAGNYRSTTNLRNLMGEAGGQVKKIKENPKNVYVKHGQRLGISDRFPGYFRLENGALWCHNQEELSSQSGIFLELLQKAGKKLMEGRGIVAVSLPVRIFEKRSTIERICDLWCTAPIFLRKAALEHDPMERMKYVITFVISGMHQVASQRKPFNPIIGETFEGVWPDGSKIYVEHISHHPPISCFQVENVDGLFTLEGSYEYTAKVTELGNSVTGRQVGKNRVKFTDGSYIEWEYPTMKISGLLYGKRTTQWVGGFEFIDKKNQLKAKMEFSKEAGFFTRQSLPTDCIEGAIFKAGQEVCKIQGSWLEFLRFNDKLYWELETCDTVRPVAVEKCLPSDCRYREDSITFAQGDLERAQQEKERLEELQRHEKRLREAAQKKKGIKPGKH